ncbi:hypothetical protein SAMN00768000_3735 [Sulfobacillus thermosulfidooxidans DSM 9293]|uniref:Uncharacterized protein n=1 Tax=Sulfobacillus thermosulfidooxidans (strain DSM 9293 / VKM B-1269 / AT-1) TaxID=929705 RepID=A0A1W1WPN3_SULTA|nr:hypothetical protein [Sulfobacillus thermosulfidooxidans]SMC08196.1 hypothetical protein SAMN00768000_3735 [Sulfobacillus thermosulfidooxidans DSM 9293]
MAMPDPMPTEPSLPNDWASKPSQQPLITQELNPDHPAHRTVRVLIPTMRTEITENGSKVFRAGSPIQRILPPTVDDHPAIRRHTLTTWATAMWQHTHPDVTVTPRVRQTYTMTIDPTNPAHQALAETLRQQPGSEDIIFRQYQAPGPRVQSGSRPRALPLTAIADQFDEELWDRRRLQFANLWEAEQHTPIHDTDYAGAEKGYLNDELVLDLQAGAPVDPGEDFLHWADRFRCVEISRGTWAIWHRESQRFVAEPLPSSTPQNPRQVVPADAEAVPRRAWSGTSLSDAVHFLRNHIPAWDTIDRTLDPYKADETAQRLHRRADLRHNVLTRMTQLWHDTAQDAAHVDPALPRHFFHQLLRSHATVPAATVTPPSPSETPHGPRL